MSDKKVVLKIADAAAEEPPVQEITLKLVPGKCNGGGYVNVVASDGLYLLGIWPNGTIKRYEAAGTWFKGDLRGRLVDVSND